MTERELKALIMGQVICGLLSNIKLVNDQGDIFWKDLVEDAAEVTDLILQAAGEK